MFDFLSKQLLDRAEYLSPYELLWRYDDLQDISKECNNNNRIVLGGDIYTIEKKFDNCGWYYNNNTNIDRNENVRKSVETMNEYLNMFRIRNGPDFFFTLVLR